jgi:hypothetical protein
MSTAAMQSQGGEVDVYGLRKRTAAACSEAKVEAAVFSGLRLRMTGGGTDDRWRHDMSRATEERERERGVRKFLSVAKESASPEILG